MLSHIWLFCDPMDCSPPGSSVHGISRARILKCVAVSFFRGSSQPRDWSAFAALQADSLQSEPICSNIKYKLKKKNIYIYRSSLGISIFLFPNYTFSLRKVSKPCLQFSVGNCCSLNVYPQADPLPDLQTGIRSDALGQCSDTLNSTFPNPSTSSCAHFAYSLISRAEWLTPHSAQFPNSNLNVIYEPFFALLWHLVPLHSVDSIPLKCLKPIHFTPLSYNTWISSTVFYISFLQSFLNLKYLHSRVIFLHTNLE